jgi:hypothetical protein
VSIFSSFLSPSLLSLTVLLLLAVLAPILVVYGRSSGRAWAALAGPQLLVTGLVLVPVAIRGPLFFWQQALFNPDFRTIFIPLFTLAATWPAFAAYTFHRNRHRRLPALARVTISVGAAITMAAAAAFLIGTERAISAINYELALLPFALSRTLGLTTHLNVTDRLTVFVAVAAAATAFGASALIWLSRRPNAPETDTSNQVLPKL